METIVNLWHGAVAQALGWTLIHSLWQGLLCFLLGVALLRIIPWHQSGWRYATSLGVFGLMLVSSAITFLLVFPPEQPAAEAAAGFSLASYSHTVANSSSVSPSWSSQLMAWVHDHVGIVSAVWLAGAVLFLLRSLGGYWYIGIIRQSAEPVGEYWQQRVDALSRRLRIRAAVEVAQSALVHAPVVMGFFRPVILVPVGMFSGLTTDQLEAIFIHELVHIRRGDYLVNLAQTILEAIYFFNPFAWMMSDAIRREREHCCDDAVVANQVNAFAYVRALATLEEAKLSRSALALSLADDKNQLLSRIRRLMEKSVHRYSGRDRVLPALLLVAGLMCASWITIKSSDRQVPPASARLEGGDAAIASFAALSDTVIREKPGVYYHYRITTIDENGEEHVSEVEGYGDDSDLGHIDEVAMPETMAPFDAIAVPIPPVVDQVVPGMSMIVAPVPPMHFHAVASDTIPGVREWQEFNVQFEESFRKRFEEFYQEHESEMKEMMKEFESKFEGFGNADFKDDFDRVRASVDRMRMEQDVALRVQSNAELAQLRMQMDQFMAPDIRELSVKMDQLQNSLTDMQRHQHDSQELLRKVAVRDGYLKEGEQIETINVRDDGMEINGHRIKPSDVQRYLDIIRAVERRLE